MQIICRSLQTDNHAIIPSLSFLQAACPSCRQTNSVNALKASVSIQNKTKAKSMAEKKVKYQIQIQVQIY